MMGNGALCRPLQVVLMLIAIGLVIQEHSEFTTEALDILNPRF